MKNEGKNNVSMCKMCTEYETQLKEALNELSSIQMVNKLLQKELYLLTTPQTIWTPNLDSNVNNSIQTANDTSKWSLITAKARRDKLKKHGVGKTLRTDHTITTFNRNAPLTKESRDKDDSIPVIVNGVHLSKGSIQAQQYTSGIKRTNMARGSIPTVL
jgi:hypothetical protein